MSTAARRHRRPPKSVVSWRKSRPINWRCGFGRTTWRNTSWPRPLRAGTTPPKKPAISSPSLPPPPKHRTRTARSWSKTCSMTSRGSRVKRRRVIREVRIECFASRMVRTRSPRPDLSGHLASEHHRRRAATAGFAEPTLCRPSCIAGLRRVDAAEAVPNGGAGSGEQHSQEPPLLIFAVEADARQRHQVLAVLGEHHAGSSGDRGLEPELAGNRELARARRGRIAERIAEMSRSRAQRRLQDRGALAHLRSRRLISELLEHAMVDRVRADRDQRVGGKLGDLRPAHAQLVPVAGGKIADHVTQFFLGLAAAQPPIQRIEQILLLLDGAAVEAAILIVDD